MANLKDILQGLADTDTEIIKKLGVLINTDTEIFEKLVIIEESVGDDLQETIEALKKGAASYSIVDHNTEGASIGGTITNDNYASDGKCCILTQSDSDFAFFTANFSDVKCGHYGLNVRMRVSDKSNTANAIKIDAKINGQIVATKSVAPSAFSNTTNFENIFLSFDYNRNSATKYPIQLVITVLGTSGTKANISFDYAYISLMMPAVFI